MKNNKINPKLLEILVCPITGSTLTYDQKKNILISKKANVYFEIKDGIPILVKEEAKKL